MTSNTSNGPGQKGSKFWIQQNCDVKLILLNLVNDPTYIKADRAS